MLNKKGTSLIELIVSVALISVVIVFLYSLLSDLKNEITNSDFAVNNQINRFEIIKAVQNDMLGEDIDEIAENNNVFTITYLNGGTTTIEITYANDDYNDLVKVTSKDGLITSWEMDGDCFIESDLNSTNIIATNLEDDITTYTLVIQIYTTNAFNISKDSNNSIDDLTFIHIND